MTAYDQPVARRNTVHWPKLAAFLVGLREAKGWAQTEAVSRAQRRKIRVSYQALRGLEEGVTKSPSPAVLRALASLYETPHEVVIAQAVNEIYGVKLGPVDFDAGESAILKARLDTEVTLRLEAESKLAKARGVLGESPPSEPGSTKGNRVRSA